MKATNVTPRVAPVRQPTGSRQIGGAQTVPVDPADRVFKVNFELTVKDAEALIRARRDVRKATLKRDLGSRKRSDLQQVDAVNGFIMLAGRVLEDEGRDSSEENFDGRP